MSAEIVNLKRARKDRARTDKERQAAENRVRFGRTKAERSIEAADAEKKFRELEGHRRADQDATSKDAVPPERDTTS